MVTWYKYILIFDMSGYVGYNLGVVFVAKNNHIDQPSD